MFMLGILVPALALAAGGGGLTWTAPATWTEDAPRPMRAATYKLPAAPGDAEGAELAVFHFGPGQGGGVEENLVRWANQFQVAAGDPRKAMQVKVEKAGGYTVHVASLAGTYVGMSGGPMAMKAPKDRFELRGAIVEGPQGLVFFKLTGPAKTVAARDAEFRAFVSSIKKG